MFITFWTGWWGFRWFIRSSKRLISRTVTVSSHLQKNIFPYLSPVCFPLSSPLPFPTLLLQLKLRENVTPPSISLKGWHSGNGCFLALFDTRKFHHFTVQEFLLYVAKVKHKSSSDLKSCGFKKALQAGNAVLVLLCLCHSWAVDYCIAKVENRAFRLVGLITLETRNPNADSPFDFIQETGLERGTAVFGWDQRSRQCTCTSGTTHSSWWFSWLHAQCVHQWQETGSKFSQRIRWHFWPLSSTWPVFWWSVQKWR